MNLNKEFRKPHVTSTSNRLQDGRSGVQIPAESRNLFLIQDAQTGCGVLPASYAMRTGVFSKSKAAYLTWTETTVPCTVIRDKFLLLKLHSHVKYADYIRCIKEPTYLFARIGEE